MQNLKRLDHHLLLLCGMPLSLAFVGYLTPGAKKMFCTWVELSHKRKYLYFDFPTRVLMVTLGAYKRRPGSSADISHMKADISFANMVDMVVELKPPFTGAGTIGASKRRPEA